MSEQRPTVSTTPELDDFAARYDRMIAEGSGRWVLKVVVVLLALLAVAGVVSSLGG